MKYKIEKIVEYLREISHPESVVGQAVTMLEQLQAENARLRSERDTAVDELRGYCAACQHYTPEHGTDICGSCVYEYPLFHRDGVVIKDRWQWAGIKEVKKNS